MTAESSGFVVGDILLRFMTAEVSGFVVGDIFLRVKTAEIYVCLLPRPQLTETMRFTTYGLMEGR